MKKVVLKESVLITVIENAINDVGDLYKKHKYGTIGEYCIIFINKDDFNHYKKAIKNDPFGETKYKPSKYFLSQYYDGSCCFITKITNNNRVKPVTFPSEKIAYKELKFMVEHSPELFNKFIYRIVKYKSIKWK